MILLLISPFIFAAGFIIAAMTQQKKYTKKIVKIENYFNEEISSVRNLERSKIQEEYEKFQKRIKDDGEQLASLREQVKYYEDRIIIVSDDYEQKGISDAQRLHYAAMKLNNEIAKSGALYFETELDAAGNEIKKTVNIELLKR